MAQPPVVATVEEISGELPMSDACPGGAADIPNWVLLRTHGTVSLSTNGNGTTGCPRK